MSTTDAFYLLLPVIPALGIAFGVGVARGEKRGYKVGFHEGSFNERMKVSAAWDKLATGLANRPRMPKLPNCAGGAR